MLRRGERARWWLLIVYEHAMLPARNKVGPCLPRANLSRCGTAAQIYTSLFWEVLL